MPTVSARTHKAGAASPELAVHRGFELRLVEVLTDAGALRPEWFDVLDAVAAHDLLLASGHLSAAETVVLFTQARRRGVRRMMVNHPMMAFLNWNEESAAALRDLGVHLELGILPDILGDPGRSCLDLTATYPASLLVFGGDLGHAQHDPPAVAVAPWLHELERRVGPGPGRRDHDHPDQGPAAAMTTIALLPGDGIGAEILDGPVAFLRQLERDGAPVRITGPWPYGTTGWAQTGSILPEETIDACRDADVILSGAVGTHPGITAEQCPNPEAALIRLRHVFDLRISVRTVHVPGGEDVIIVRNITGGAYAGPDRHAESDGDSPAEDRLVLEPARVREVFDIAVGYARRHPGQRAISVDKASVFATSRLWRRIAHEASAPRASRSPTSTWTAPPTSWSPASDLPSVIVTEGIFGDILSDVVCARAGSPALCGSATINPDRAFGHGATGLFEPAHGSSPHRTGSRRSNPAGAWLALADLLAWCPDLAALGLHARVRRALDTVLDDGRPDLRPRPAGDRDHRPGRVQRPRPRRPGRPRPYRWRPADDRAVPRGRGGRPRGLPAPGPDRIQDQLRHLVRMGDQREVPGVDLDRRGAHAPGEEALKLRGRRAVLPRDGVPGWLGPPRRNRGLLAIWPSSACLAQFVLLGEPTLWGRAERRCMYARRFPGSGVARYFCSQSRSVRDDSAE